MGLPLSIMEQSTLGIRNQKFSDQEIDIPAYEVSLNLEIIQGRISNPTQKILFVRP